MKIRQSRHEGSAEVSQEERWNKGKGEAGTHLFRLHTSGRQQQPQERRGSDAEGEHCGDVWSQAGTSRAKVCRRARRAALAPFTPPRISSGTKCSSSQKARVCRHGSCVFFFSLILFTMCHRVRACSPACACVHRILSRVPLSWGHLNTIPIAPATRHLSEDSVEK